MQPKEPNERNMVRIHKEICKRGARFTEAAPTGPAVKCEDRAK